MSGSKEEHPRPVLGISACLLGQSVRYDGGHRRDDWLADVLGRHVTWLPVCPEAECGLGVPREPMRLEPGPRLVVISTGEDMTERMTEWCAQRVKALPPLAGFFLKARSPSCAPRALPQAGMGLFAAALVDAQPLMPLEDEGAAHEAKESFLTQCFALSRWLDFSSQRATRGGLMEFHARHKYLLMTHSPAHYRSLGALAADERPLPTVLAQYARGFMDALAQPATPAKNANAMEHIMGYFKKNLSTADRHKITDAIKAYRMGLAPLAEPLSLLRGHAAALEEPYLLKQHYLFPHPSLIELLYHP